MRFAYLITALFFTANALRLGVKPFASKDFKLQSSSQLDKSKDFKLIGEEECFELIFKDVISQKQLLNFEANKISPKLLNSKISQLTDDTLINLALSAIIERKLDEVVLLKKLSEKKKGIEEIEKGFFKTIAKLGENYALIKKIKELKSLIQANLDRQLLDYYEKVASAKSLKDLEPLKTEVMEIIDTASIRVSVLILKRIKLRKEELESKPLDTSQSPTSNDPSYSVILGKDPELKDLNSP